jgi:DNA-binding response OmpR family regulator
VKAQAPKRILVVDDEPSVTGALAVILGEAGYDVVIADTIAQASRF